MDDDHVAHGAITRELFLSGPEGEAEVNQRVGTIEIEAVRNDAKFNLAKLYYEAKHDAKDALNKALEITDLNEQTRCLVHLALSVLKNEGNQSLADELVALAKKDDEGYLKYYKLEKEKASE